MYTTADTHAYRVEAPIAIDPSSSSDTTTPAAGTLAPGATPSPGTPSPAAADSAPGEPSPGAGGGVRQLGNHESFFTVVLEGRLFFVRGG